MIRMSYLSYKTTMELFFIGLLLSTLSTVTIQAIQKQQILIAGGVAGLTTYLNVHAIVEIVGGAESLVYAIGIGVGAALTVFWNKKRGA